MTRVAVIGIGQSMRGDDAVGIEAVHQWQKKFPETANRPEVQIETNELPGLSLLDSLSEVDAAVLVDAVQSTGRPGAIHRLDETELMTFMADSKSAHGWGIAETLRMGRQLAEVSSVIRIVGIEAEHFDMGFGMNTAVADAMPAICNVIEEEINQLLG